MVEVNVEALLNEFFRKAEEFIAEPSLVKGLDLDELAGRTSSACSSRYGTASGLVGRFFAFMKAIPRHDREELQRLLEEIRAILSGLPR